ncbi:MAG TPA: HAMP domain-containing sensor histidine kinase [Thermomicrobiales bacterium]|nr:HAMP domain-containing sensor histidine kinase [Thermomicrobiales bacterium]
METTSPARGLASRLKTCVSLPWRLFQERTSVQLIAGYVAVVLLVILLFEFTVVVAILWSPRSGLLSTGQYMSDPFLGERSAAIVQWLDPSRIQRGLQDDAGGALIRSELDRRLYQIAAGSVPGLESITPSMHNGVDAAIFDTSGTVIASSGSWISSGQSVEDLPTATQREVASQGLALAGAGDSATGTHYSLASDGSATVSSYPIKTSDGTWIGTLVLQGGSIADQLGSSRGEVIRELMLGFLQSLWIFAIPALIVAIPFGFWRARGMSRRLQRLAEASEAMAKGNLRTRVRVARKDEIGRLGESFNDMAEQIDRNDRARRAFITNISHELRTPVAIIQGTSERLLERTCRSVPEAVEGLTVIQHEGQMLVRLIDDLFAIARIEEHNLRLDRAPLTVASVVDEVLASVRDLAWTQHKISIESIVSDDLPPVFADRDRLRQIISNLVYNALRHTPEGGLIIIQATESGPQIAIEVSDTGMGIEPDQLELIFTRYGQSEQTRRRGGGSGLGLAIVAQLVNAHGGEISVSSTVGQGTTFRFTLPKAR